jgi:hypothetical protein
VTASKKRSLSREKEFSLARTMIASGEKTSAQIAIMGNCIGRLTSRIIGLNRNTRQRKSARRPTGTERITNSTTRRWKMPDFDRISKATNGKLCVRQTVAGYIRDIIQEYADDQDDTNLYAVIAEIMIQAGRTVEDANAECKNI